LFAERSELLAEILALGKKRRNAAGSGMADIASPGILKSRHDRTRLSVPASCQNRQASSDHKNAKRLHRILLK
jgi:hypothetical protein